VRVYGTVLGQPTGMLDGVHRGVLYGAIAFGLAVSLVGFVYILATGKPLKFAVFAAAMLAAGLVVYPLRFVLFRRASLRGSRRETFAVALLVFALLTAATGIIVAVVGKEAWFGRAAALVLLAGAIAAAGAWALKRREAPDAITWDE
jgi:hypothetical protein